MIRKLIIGSLLLGGQLACNNEETLVDQRAQGSETVEKIFADFDNLEEHQLYGEGEVGVGSLEYARLSWWERVQSYRQDKVESFFATEADGLEYFERTPITTNGAPAIVFQLLPHVMPEVAGPLSLEAYTGLAKDNPEDALPYGMALTSPAMEAGQNPSIQFVNFTCAACHSNVIKDDQGNRHRVIGAPSTTTNINGYRALLGSAVNNPSYDAQAFKTALEAIPPGELYGPENIQKEMFDRAVFLGTDSIPSQAEAIVEGFKTTVNQKAQFIGSTIAAFSYATDPTLLGNSPGHVEAFAFATLAFMPLDEFFANPSLALQKYFKPYPSVADIMSVWKQKDREFAQWDGNIKAPLIRNLGAELAVGGDPKVVNYDNAVATTSFVSELPSPVYPNDVNLKKAILGKIVYEYSCASCHENQTFMSVEKVGTEPGRALGLSSAARELLIENLKAACFDKSNPDCNVPDDEIIVNRQDNPGYISLPLDGIWARAPYLHNGSIPTIEHLLVPESRPETFYTGANTIDEKKLGFDWENGKYLYDTKVLGYSNSGHADLDVFNRGIDFGRYPKLKDALIEYLKTL